MKYGIVFAGGGVRGAFQMGVWKALRKMNIELCAAAGTSIGGINAALVAQDEYETAMKMWRKITIEDIITLPDGMEGETDIFKLKNLTGMAKDMYKNEGLDMTPLETILRDIIDEDKLRNSPIDFGIATFSLTRKKGMYKFKDDIPKGQLLDYIMAGASILTAKQIDDEKFSDGGMYDNMPVTMLIDRGIRDIITVDVQGIGISRGYVGAGKNIIPISVKDPQTGIMDFDKLGISKSIEEGYIACLKAFGRVMGEDYAFDANDYLGARARCGEELIRGVEKAAGIFGINALEIYTFDGLVRIIIDEYMKRSARADISIDISSVDKLKKTGDEAILMWLVKALENEALLTDKLSAFTPYYDAASSILYFKN